MKKNVYLVGKEITYDTVVLLARWEECWQECHRTSVDCVAAVAAGFVILEAERRVSSSPSPSFSNLLASPSPIPSSPALSAGSSSPTLPVGGPWIMYSAGIRRWHTLIS